MTWVNERTYPRYQCLGDAKFNLVGKVTETWAQVLNVSLGGCLLNFPTASTLQTGADLELTIRIGGTSFRVRGWVVPGENQQRMLGVMFASMGARDRASLVAVVGELEAAGMRNGSATAV